MSVCACAVGPLDLVLFQLQLQLSDFGWSPRNEMRNENEIEIKIEIPATCTKIDNNNNNDNNELESWFQFFFCFWFFWYLAIYVITSAAFGAKMSWLALQAPKTPFAVVDWGWNPCRLHNLLHLFIDVDVYLGYGYADGYGIATVSHMKWNKFLMTSKPTERNQLKDCSLSMNKSHAIQW